MKTIAIALLFSCSFLQAGTEAVPENTVDQRITNYLTIAEEFHQCLTSIAPLTIAITDKKSLKKSITTLRINQQRVTQLLARLGTFPIPTEAEKKVINAKMETEELKLKELLKDKFINHMKTMPPHLMKEWQPIVEAFYKNLDTHKEITNKYFKTEEQEGKSNEK